MERAEKCRISIKVDKQRRKQKRGELKWRETTNKIEKKYSRESKG